METTYHAVILAIGPLPEIEAVLDDGYTLHQVGQLDAIQEGVWQYDAKLILVDLVSIGPKTGIAACRQLKDDPATAEVPLVMLANSETLKHRMSAYEAGCDDYLVRSDLDEMKPRLDRVLFNKVANDQLKVQLKHANEMAFIAMSDTSDLGVNIQFLLDVNTCNNLDELGMRLFQALKSYGINCSLQIRSRFVVKNMEANGMAKELEAALLMECRDQGRYVDFGKRSIMNYGSVSILVKNMPVDDRNKYGAIKDNVFSLLQGAHARTMALDNLYSLEIEGQLVRRLVSSMRGLMASVDDSYQLVMRDIANVVEGMAEGVESSLQFLGMDEQQERAIQNIMEQGVADTSKVFNEGIRIDDGLSVVLDKINRAIGSGHGDMKELTRLLELLPSVVE